MQHLALHMGIFKARSSRAGLVLMTLWGERKVRILTLISGGRRPRRCSSGTLSLNTGASTKKRACRTKGSRMHWPIPLRAAPSFCLPLIRL